MGKREELRKLEADIRKLRNLKKELKASRAPDKKPTRKNVGEAIREYQALSDQINDLNEERESHRNLLMAWLDKLGVDFDEVDGFLLKRSTAKRKKYDDDGLKKRLGDDYDQFISFTEYYRLSIKDAD